MHSNIFLIHTNHQLHQVTKAIKYFKIAKQNIVILNVNFSNEKEIVQNYGNKYGYNVINLDNWTFKDLIFKRYIYKKYVFELNQIYIFSESINFFTSQYLNDTVLLANLILKPSKFYLMDEGTASFMYSDIRENNKESYLIKFIKSFFYKQYLSIPKSITYFTKFDFKITKNNDSLIKYNEEKLENNIKKINDKQVFYIGSSISDLRLINENHYINYLRLVFEFYDTKTVYYIPHRKETLNKLEKIKNIGYKIKSIEIPFEMWYKSAEIIPGEISSHYYSTVLGNLVDQFKNIPRLRGFVSSSISVSKEKIYEDKIFLNLKSKMIIDFTDL